MCRSPAHSPSIWSNSAWRREFSSHPKPLQPKYENWTISPIYYKKIIASYSPSLLFFVLDSLCEVFEKPFSSFDFFPPFEVRFGFFFAGGSSVLSFSFEWSAVLLLLFRFIVAFTFRTGSKSEFFLQKNHKFLGHASFLMKHNKHKQTSRRFLVSFDF